LLIQLHWSGKPPDHAETAYGAKAGIITKHTFGV